MCSLTAGLAGHDHWEFNFSVYIEATLVCVLLVDSCWKGICAEKLLMKLGGYFIMQVMLKAGKDLLKDLLITMERNYFTSCMSKTSM